MMKAVTEARDHEIRPLPRAWVTWAVVAAIGVVGIVAMVLLVYSGGPGDPASDVDEAIETVVPEPQAQAPRQSRVGVRLRPEWALEAMTVAGRVIPLDQLEVREALGEWFYEPGPGGALELLPAGAVCVALEIRRVLDPPERRDVGWCFTAV
jgi:hypothetical protein